LEPEERATLIFVEKGSGVVTRASVVNADPQSVQRRAASAGSPIRRASRGVTGLR